MSIVVHGAWNMLSNVKTTGSKLLPTESQHLLAKETKGQHRRWSISLPFSHRRSFLGRSMVAATNLLGRAGAVKHDPLSLSLSLNCETRPLALGICAGSGQGLRNFKSDDINFTVWLDVRRPVTPVSANSGWRRRWQTDHDSLKSRYVTSHLVFEPRHFRNFKRDTCHPADRVFHRYTCRSGCI